MSRNISYDYPIYLSMFCEKKGKKGSKKFISNKKIKERNEINEWRILDEKSHENFSYRAPPLNPHL